MRLPSSLILLTLSCAAALATPAAEPTTPAAVTKDGLDFFERHIRPVLVQSCYECHSVQSGKSKGKLLLDSRAGVARGGEGGPVVVPGDPAASRLIAAIRWTKDDFEMPPKQKLSAAQIEKFEQWVRMGAPDPRDEAAASVKAPKETTTLENGKKWWA